MESSVADTAVSKQCVWLQKTAKKTVQMLPSCTLEHCTVQTLCLLAGGRTDILGSSSSNLQNTFCLIKQAFSPQQLQWSPLNIDFFVSGNWAFQILICSFSQIRLCIVYILCIYICMHTKSWLNLPPIIGKSNLFLCVHTKSWLNRSQLLTQFNLVERAVSHKSSPFQQSAA